MSAKRMLIVLVCLGVVAGCGSDPASDASSKGKSFEEAIGMDEASMQAREVKVQEAVRTCMKAEGFDYIPVDPSQGGMSMKFDADDSISMKEDWGHSSNVVAIDLCHQAQARRLALFHQEPTYSDAGIQRMHQESIRYEELTRGGAPLEVICTYDGLTVDV